VTALLLSLLCLASGAAGSLLLANRGRWATYAGVSGTLVGCAIGVVPALHATLGGAAFESLRFAWSVPYGSIYLELDALSGFFLLPVFVLGALGAIYGAGYLEDYRGKKSLGPPWFFFNLLIASMIVVLVARNAVLFLLAWETVALSSLFLVTFEDERAEVRRAGWIYLVASHAGTAFLLLLFIMLAQPHVSFDFDRFDGSPHASLLFVVGLIGFGTKAGFVPFHVWLPEAHPAAPSHVSALMSGAMIKTGIYGLLRLLLILGTPALWWGWVLCGLGVTSTLVGVLLALAQTDLKRLLAYSSVENIGIIAIGIGLGVIGLAAGKPVIAVAGFAGALLHVLNHSLFKGLLFMAAGNVIHGTHLRELDRLGGLIKRMPRTGLLFLFGVIAIVGLPPLNGFVSELLIYLASLMEIRSLVGANLVVATGTIASLGLVGGLAVVCFTKAFGTAFLGHPRSEAATHAAEVDFLMQIPLMAVALACVLIGLFGAAIVAAFAPVVIAVSGLPLETIQNCLSAVSHSLRVVGELGAAVIGLMLLLAAGRFLLLSKRSVRQSITWDCGYLRPSARMQYTGSSFVQPLTNIFSLMVNTRTVIGEPQGLFPSNASFSIETPDPAEEYLFTPLFRSISRSLSLLRPLQQGQVQLYVLYIALTLILLLLWQLG